MEMCTADQCTAGATAAIALVGADFLVLANLGDSRAVLFESDGASGFSLVCTGREDGKLCGELSCRASDMTGVALDSVLSSKCLAFPRCWRRVGGEVQNRGPQADTAQ